MTEPTVDWIGPGGRKLDGPAGAIAVEVQEYDSEGVPADRTYAELAPAPRVVLAQTAAEEDVADPDVADSAFKGTWDLWFHDGVHVPVPVETLEQLWWALSAGDTDGSRQAALLNALELPSWDSAPDDLKTAAYAWLDAHPPQTAGTDGA